MDSPVYAHIETIAPGVRRVVARNPSPFTLHGTGTYILGEGTVAVIDPGPADPEHIDALVAELAGETISHILITHTHRDHSPGAAPLKARTGAIIAGCARLAPASAGFGYDETYAPDRVLADGDQVTSPGWTVTAVATPGHTSNHLCFAWEEAKALFTGDHVMGWSTTVVSPPDGDMTAYMASLDKLLGRDDVIYYPTHGDPVTRPQRLVRGLIGRRRQRENEILDLLGAGEQTIPDMVAKMYRNTDPRLHVAAGRSVLAHLLDLEARGRVAAEGEHWRRAA